MANTDDLKTALKYAFIDLQVKREESSALDQLYINKELDKLADQIAKLNNDELKAGTIVTDADMADMAEIKKEIDAAADKQQLIAAIAKAVAFVAKKVM